jgi:uncharacterized phosphosugar-binding protein
MDIKKQYFEAFKDQLKKAELQKDKIHELSLAMKKVMDKGGVIQLFGTNHGEEFVNELFFRAGGLVPYHGLKLEEMALQGHVSNDDYVSRKIYDQKEIANVLIDNHKADPNDALFIASYKGNEPLAIELARIYHENSQKVFALINKKSYDEANQNAQGKELLDYVDLWLDMDSPDPDVVLQSKDKQLGQVSSTFSNCLAQMLTAEIYARYKEAGSEAPVLLSANLAGADVHNKNLTDQYNGRVR